MADSTVFINVDQSVRHQAIDGFGFCEAFQRATIMRGSRGLPPAKQREVLDLLLSTTHGAGFSILRLGIGSSGDEVYDHMRSIAPISPGGPEAPMKYEWDADDSGQLWLAQRAAEYGVRQYYACAWSAPGYMMSNGKDTGGGFLNGLPGTPQGQPDWRARYAEYLLEYVRCYRREGIEITHLGFTNEPDLFLVKRPDEIHYAAMRMDYAQVVDFVKVLGRAVERSDLPVSIVCCDAMSWAQQARYTAAIEADPEAAARVAVHAGHNYAEPARSRLPTARKTWMSEWEPDVGGNTWIPGWDTGNRSDGIQLANDIHDALTAANVSGYIYWLGASVGGTRALIQLDGARYHVSKRLWAMAGYSRFIRPEAVRVEATADDSTVKVSAFVNPAGPVVVNLINGGAERPARFGSLGRHATEGVTAYVTDEARSMAPVSVDWSDGGPAVLLPARSLTTLVLA
ncbi:glycoside hydrolase family 30 protein [Phytohabitans houttuyneae]|uniref:Xylanase n=1 Tax=Phytohabitans houttuyneae TaxID=1076126 RepID=A0A6V8K3G7_9ACTN|nr:glycoside hydrolase [Phytohabitans houttuyneae]GFJ78060.1 hypothetical protein Phou_022400 [Phytohabitans houttuyneae]